jgi:GntR family transcriptional regulator
VRPSLKTCLHPISPINSLVGRATLLRSQSSASSAGASLSRGRLKCCYASTHCERFLGCPLIPDRACVYTVYMERHSWITVSLSDPRPLYLQVIEQVRRRVAMGDLPAGTELPSIRELAADLKVSVITIKRAYMELERDGVILTRQGKGSVIADSPGLSLTIQESQLKEQLNEIAKLGLWMGISKTEMQRRLSDAYEQQQRNSK